MTLSSRLLARTMRLPPVTTYQVRVDRDIPVPASDGVILRTDHWYPEPESGAGTTPTVLIRTPYGKTGLVGLLSGRLWAERGFQVILQACRGTGGSDGAFEPMRHERADGLAAIEWIKGQPWFDGNLFTYGPSYLGFTQWAVGAEAGACLRGMLLAVTSSDVRDPTYAGGAFSLDTVLNWTMLTSNMGGSMLRFMVRQQRAQSRLRRALHHLPLSEVDTMVTGRAVGFFQEWLTHVEPGDPYWDERRWTQQLATLGVPVAMVAGWYDIFLPWQLRDYQTLHAAGSNPQLTIGPWTHADLGLLASSMRTGMRFFRAQLNGGSGGPPVRVYVPGAGRWRQYDQWPPPARTVRWYLRSSGRLADQPPTDAAAPPASFTYDPADPTPSPGGALLTRDAGRVDNRQVEARSDVLVYTSRPLASPLEVIGPVSATVYLRSSVEHLDVFVRLCVVSPSGRSENLSDGLTRLTAESPATGSDGIRQAHVELWPTAYRFAPGDRIRIQVAGGAHPRYARNPGTGEPLATATELRLSHNEVFADAAHPSAIELAVPLPADG